MLATCPIFPSSRGSRGGVARASRFPELRADGVVSPVRVPSDHPGRAIQWNGPFLYGASTPPPEAPEEGNIGRFVKLAPMRLRPGFSTFLGCNYIHGRELFFDVLAFARRTLIFALLQV